MHNDTHKHEMLHNLQNYFEKRENVNQIVLGIAPKSIVYTLQLVWSCSFP